MVITSLNNEHIKELNKLKEKKQRDKTNTFLIEGKHLVLEAHKNNKIEELILLDTSDIQIKNVPITYVSKEVMKKLSHLESYPEVIAVCKKNKEREIKGNVLILEDIQDPGNLGTIIRSSLAFNVDTIILSLQTVDLYNDKVIRSTQGMLFNINIIVRNIEDEIRNLKERKYKIYGTKVDKGLNVKNIVAEGNYALIIGNEGNGMSKNISSLCDEYLYIETNQKVESLNAAVAASILLYELSNK